MQEAMDSLKRRKMLGLFGGGMVLGLHGCCLHPFPAPQIGRALLAGDEPQFLRPRRVNKALSKDVFCVDVHGHFFNASDVTVKGYLEGPVAHSLGGDLGKLVRLLAPLADALAELAPTAKAEYDKLSQYGTDMRLLSDQQREDFLDDAISKERTRQSQAFFELLQTPAGLPFRREYETLKSAGIRRTPALRAISKLDEASLAMAMEMGERPDPLLREMKTPPDDGAFYAEGILAFVGYMLSSRWANLRSYQNAFSGHAESLGVDRVVAALVDFDRWLDCPPRSSHEDQMRLHARLATLSDHYLVPIVGYNPWSDVAEQGKALALVEQAARAGFVGAKIYPANGYRPWGNTAAQDGPGLPPHDGINKALEAFWNKCIELDIAVMAHTSQSMGKDDTHDALGGPDGWKALIAEYGKRGHSPRINLGHFGGDTRGATNDWTKQMADVMSKAGGEKVYGDLGYWSELQCSIVGVERCEAAKQRLTNVMNDPIGGGGRVADRMMFGSDWLMLSRERDWFSYASELFVILQAVAPNDVANIFGFNATKCLGQIVGPNTKRTLSP